MFQFSRFYTHSLSSRPCPLIHSPICRSRAGPRLPCQNNLTLPHLPLTSLLSTKEQFALFPSVLSSVLFLSLLRKNCSTLSFFHVPAHSTYITLVVAGRGLGSLVKTISPFTSLSFRTPFSRAFVISSLSLSHSLSLTSATIFFVPLTSSSSV